MRVVIDTNVLVSGLLNPHGAPGRIVDLMLAGDLVPLFDDRVLSEYRDVLHRPRFAFDADEVEALLDYIETFGEHVVAGPLAVTLPDADDLPFLEVAEAARADALMTGNTRHFVPISGKTSVTIMAPGEAVTAR